MATPHDSLFQDTFGKPEHAAPLLRALLPPALSAAIDWDSLHPAVEHQVDEHQQNQHQDRMFTVHLHGRPALVYVLFEHKSRPDRWTALQVLAYVVGIWKDLRRRRPRPRRLPPVLPVVVSFGRRRWHASTDLEALLDLDGLPTDIREPLLAAMPRFRFTPHDFAAASEADVRAMGLSLLGMWTVVAQQFVAPVGHDDEAAVRAIAEWALVTRDVITAPTRQGVVEALSSYFLKVTRLSRRRLGLVFEQHFGDASMQKFESTYDRITRESKALGKAEGKVEGKVEGAASLLLRLLHRRFGPVPASAAERIRGATREDLDRWAERVLEAPTLDAVLEA